MKLNNKHKIILQQLALNPYTSQIDLAKMVNLSRPATANLISKLINEGHILGKGYILPTHHSNRIVMIGGTNMDQKLYMQEPLVFHTSNPVDKSFSYGGVIRNVAENLGRLLPSVCLLTTVGQDGVGQNILNHCSHMMDVSGSEVVKGAVTGSYIALMNLKGDLEIGFSDMSVTDRIDIEWIKARQTYLNDCQRIVIDTNLKKEVIDYIKRIAQEKQIPLTIIGVSTVKIANLPDDLTGIDLVIFNLHETQEAFKTLETDIEVLTKRWLTKGVVQAIVTNGSDNVGVVDTTGYHEIKVKPVDQMVDATGAGDSFSAGTLYGLAQGKTLLDSCQYGLVNARLTIQSSSSVREDLSEKLLIQEREIYEKI